MNSPLVSICCLAYNHEEYIGKCLNGFMMQKTDFEFEVLIHDDASTDKTADIIRDYERKFPNIIKPVYQTENQFSKGIGVTTKYNFSRTKGKYIAMCEGDDYWTDPLKLQKQVDFLETNEDVVISGHDAYIINEKGEKIKDSKLPEFCKKDASGNDLKKLFWILTLTMVFRNIPEFLIDWKHIATTKNGDTCLISILGNYGSFHYHKDINPAAYRVHHGGVWSVLSNEKKIKHHLITLNVLLNFYRKKEDMDMVRFYREKIEHKRIEQFDFVMNNYGVFRKTVFFYKTLILNNNWTRKERLIYLFKAYLKNLITTT